MKWLNWDRLKILDSWQKHNNKNIKFISNFGILIVKSDHGPYTPDPPGLTTVRKLREK